jgi:hypothetical protein
MYHYTAMVIRNEEGSASTFRVTDIFDHNGQACGGTVDISTKYQSVTTMTDHLARQLGVSAESLTIIQDTVPSTDPSLPT